MRRTTAAFIALAILLPLLFWAAARSAARAPVLRVQGDRLTVDGTPRFLVFLSYFDGVRRARAGNLGVDFSYLKGRVDGIRVFPNWWASTCPVRSGADTLIDLDGTIRTAVWRDLKRLLDEASTERLLVDVSFTRETVTDNASPPRVLSHEAYERALARLVGDQQFFKGHYPNVAIDVQNEWTRFATSAQIEKLLQRVHEADPQRVLMASVSGDAYVASGRAIPTMVAAYHDPRGGDWFTPDVISRHVRDVRAIARQPVYLQEPMPASTACGGQIVDSNPAHFEEAVAAARAAGAAAWTFHTRSTFDLSKESLVEKLGRPAEAGQKRAIDALNR